MKTIIINENEKGLLFVNGKYKKTLSAGKYRTFGNKTVEVFSVNEYIAPQRISVEALLANEDFAMGVITVEVKENELMLHYMNGQFVGILRAGRYVYFKSSANHVFQAVNLDSPIADGTVPTYIFGKISSMLYSRVEVAEYQKARLYINRKLVKILDAGVYYFWRTQDKVDVEVIDTRLCRMELCGQEMLTQDKVTLRVNFVCSYRVTDYVKVVTEIDDYKEQLHIAAQLALREFVGKYKLDDLLENKEEMSAFVLKRLKEKEASLFIAIEDAGVKDIILPGEIREIMNTVLIAEKRAQANVITRREEVASTRSLLNTAKMMEENATLYKLKELEYIERISENVGNITVNGCGNLLEQLASILGTKK